MSSPGDQYFSRNAAGVALVEFFWGLGFPVVMESTFLQIFLKNLGASDFLIGLVPSILMLGISVFPLFSSYLTRDYEYKRPIVLGLHLVSSLSTLGFGIFLFSVQTKGFIIPAFFISYVIFSLCIGLTFPVWLNFLVKIFPAEKNVQGLAIMYSAQNAAKIISSFLIIKVVESYSFSIISAAWIFLTAGLLFLCGSFCFLITKEPTGSKPLTFEKDSFLQHVWKTVKEITGNRNLLKFLVGDMDIYVSLTIVAFYANYATQHFGIRDYTAAGLFVCFIYSGAILSNIFLGTFNWLSFKLKFISTKIANLFVLCLLVFYPNLAGFLIASLLLGFCRGTRGIIYSPAVKKFSERHDATAYFAVVPLLTIWFSSGFPLLFGHMLDRLSRMGETAYQIMFGLSFICVIIFLLVGCFTDFSPQQGLNRRKP